MSGMYRKYETYNMLLHYLEFMLNYMTEAVDIEEKNLLVSEA